MLVFYAFTGALFCLPIIPSAHREDTEKARFLGQSRHPLECERYVRYSEVLVAVIFMDVAGGNSTPGAVEAGKHSLETEWSDGTAPAVADKVSSVSTGLRMGP